MSVNEIIDLTARQQETNLELIKRNIEEKLTSIENNSVVLARQSSLHEVIHGNHSHFQRNALTLDFSNSVYSNGDIHSIEIFMENPPTNNIQNPVRYYNINEAYETNWIGSLDKQIATWIGIRPIEMMAGNEVVISYARILKNSRGHVQAILVLNLDPLIVENWLRSYPNDSILYLINENQHILASTDYKSIGENNDIQIETESNQATTHFTQDEQLIVSSEIKPYNWKLIGVTPYSELTKSSNQVARNIVLFSFILLLVFLIGMSFIINQLTKPIHQLTKLMNDYKLNRTNQIIPNDYTNEFGKLFHGYQNLINRNERLFNSLIKQYKSQKRAELRALQANINPHFLYNTLDQLNWRAIERGDDDMSLMIELLGDMLRVGLSNGEAIISIEDEVNYVEKYLKLQSIRNKESFRYHFNIDKQALHAYIPKLTLQPFVENAIIHGLANKNNGLITITIHQQEDHIVLSIKDNGSGAQSFQKSRKKMKTGGYGIRNVKERLNHYYNYKAKIFLSNRSEGGVEVKITIPKVTDKSDLF